MLNNQESSSSFKLEELLHRYFGYTSFRPLQREIVEAALAGKDVVALLPTGGGKSLCYQLPALARSGLTVVLSPLIALMKDQVDALTELGIPATFLNSSLTSEESKDRWRKLNRGEYKLLYLSPERLALEGMDAILKEWNISAIAIDEAHCISEWGHDFRPEYRELTTLREKFPGLPLMALTATATPRVQEDIAQLLKLDKPSIFTASFNRPNLSYRILPRSDAMKQITEVIEQNRGESGIVYCLSRARTEEVAEGLRKKGISALAYHAGLDSRERTARQEQFIKDEVLVMAATVAFGMGVDKPDVRFVIHHDLPKNIESYYQETGRAGRDGLPSECVLLYSAGDVGKIYGFIDQMGQEQERQIARRQLGRLVELCESAACRRVELLRYFGEEYQDSDGEVSLHCGSCDNCLTPRESVDGTALAQKMLSCVLRIQKQSGFSVGLQHLVDVLCGADTEKIRRWNHHELSTYGIGKDITRAEWSYYGREFLRIGLLRQEPERFNVIEVTDAGIVMLKEKQSVTIRKPVLSAKLAKEKRQVQKKVTGAQEYDVMLFEKLRSWRKGLSQQKGLPAYVIFQDNTLQQIAREKPTTITALANISGVGDKKLAQYGEEVLRVVKER